MAVKAIIGFDVVPGALGSTSSPYWPTLSAGLAHLVDLYGASVIGASTINTVGVTGRLQDQFAHGANALVAISNRASAVAQVYLPGTAYPLSADVPWKYTVGFRFKIDSLSAANPAGNATFFQFAGYAILRVSSTGTLLFMGMDLGALTRGREYYFEMMMENEEPGAGPGFTPKVSLWIDGEWAGKTDGPTIPGPTVGDIRMGCFGRTGSTTNNVQRFLFGDMYINDVEGVAPYNGPLGPQRVKPLYPDEVVVNEWALSTGADPLAIVGQANGTNTSTYLTSPPDSGETSYKFGIPTGELSIVNGITLLALAQRDAGDSRGLVGQIHKGDDTLLAEGGPSDVGTASYKYYSVAHLAPQSAVDANNLRHSVLQDAVFSLKGGA